MRLPRQNKINLLLPDAEGAGVTFELAEFCPINTAGAVLGAGLGRSDVGCGVLMARSGSFFTGIGFVVGVSSGDEIASISNDVSTVSGFGGNVSEACGLSDSSTGIGGNFVPIDEDSSREGGIVSGRVLFFEGLAGDLSGVRVNPVLSSRFDFADKKVVSRFSRAISSPSASKGPGNRPLNSDDEPNREGGSAEIGSGTYGSRPNFFSSNRRTLA